MGHYTSVSMSHPSPQSLTVSLWVIPGLDALGEVSLGVPEGISHSQSPENGELIQELSHVAQGHVEVHGEDTCKEQGHLEMTKLHPPTSPGRLLGAVPEDTPFLKSRVWILVLKGAGLSQSSHTTGNYRAGSCISTAGRNHGLQASNSLLLGCPPEFSLCFGH